MNESGKKLKGKIVYLVNDIKIEYYIFIIYVYRWYIAKENNKLIVYLQNKITI